MRPLKFRVWSDFWEKYADFEAELYMDGSVDADFEDDNGIPHHETTDLVIEQYTGLKDKNGKEIYEGDIVSYRGNNYQIKWCEASFVYIASSKNQYYWLSPSKSTVFEVIGNIHENPRMVEGTK